MGIQEPQTWRGRLFALGVVLFVAGLVMRFIPTVKVPGVIILIAGVCMILLSSWRSLVSEAFQSSNAVAAGSLGMVAVTFFGLFASLIVFLVTGGDAAAFHAMWNQFNSNTWPAGLDLALLTPIPFFLIIRPEFLRRKLAFGDASDSTRNLLTARWTAYAAIATFVYLSGRGSTEGRSRNSISTPAS